MKKASGKFGRTTESGARTKGESPTRRTRGSESRLVSKCHAELPVEIRPLTRKEAGAFWHLRLEGLEEAALAFAESAEEHRATPVEVVAARLAPTRSGNFVLGAFTNGELIGIAGFARHPRPRERHKGRVWGVYVQAACRGRGIGQRLLAELICRAQSQTGLEQLVLTVGERQTSARRLYVALGFRVFGRERHALKIGDLYVNEDHMVLHLGHQT